MGEGGAIGQLWPRRLLIIEALADAGARPRAIELTDEHLKRPDLPEDTRRALEALKVRLTAPATPEPAPPSGGGEAAPQTPRGG